MKYDKDYEDTYIKCTLVFGNSLPSLAISKLFYTQMQMKILGFSLCQNNVLQNRKAAQRIEKPTCFYAIYSNKKDYLYHNK